MLVVDVIAHKIGPSIQPLRFLLLRNLQNIFFTDGFQITQTHHGLAVTQRHHHALGQGAEVGFFDAHLRLTQLYALAVGESKRFAQPIDVNLGLTRSHLGVFAGNDVKHLYLFAVMRVWLG